MPSATPWIYSKDRKYRFTIIKETYGNDIPRKFTGNLICIIDHDGIVGWETSIRTIIPKNGAKRLIEMLG